MAQGPMLDRRYCSICYIYNDSSAPVPQQCVHSCTRYLAEEIIRGINWENREGGGGEGFVGPTICHHCLKNSVKLSQLHSQLENLQKEIADLVQRMTEHIYKERKQYEGLQSATAAQIVVGNPPHADTNYFASNIYQFNWEPNEFLAHLPQGENTSCRTTSPSIHTSTSALNSNKEKVQSALKSYRVIHSPTSKTGKTLQTQIQKVSQSQEEFQNQKSESVEGNIPIICHQSEKENPESVVVTSTINLKQNFSSNPKFKCAKCQKMFTRLHTLDNHDCSKRTWECKYCSKSFSSISSLKLHHRTHTGEKPYKCEVCDKKFSIKQHLNIHASVMHKAKEELPTFECKICGKTFVRYTGLNKHKKIHNKSTLARKFKCEVENCSKSFSEFSALSSHVKYMHTNTRRYNCDICGISMKKMTHLKSHYQIVHLNEKFKCDAENCHKVFISREKLDRHKLILHSGVNQFTCQVCGKSFQRRYMLNRHLKKVHAKRGQTLDCQLCGKIFASLDLLTEHILAHSRTDSKSIPHSCDLCKKTFNTLQGLLNHGCESGAIIFNCPKCEQTFINKYSRDAHTATAHKEKVFECHKCYSKDFLTETALRNHLEKHDKKQPISYLPGVNFQCRICGLVYQKKYGLENHLAMFHTVLTAYFCDLCGKQFEDRELFGNHRRYCRTRRSAGHTSIQFSEIINENTAVDNDLNHK